MQKRRIGRNVGPGPLAHAFDLVREDDGRILIQRATDHGPSDAETRAIMQRMTTPVTGLGGPGTDDEGRQVDAVVTVQPGTREHYDYAVHQLPAPFFVMG